MEDQLAVQQRVLLEQLHAAPDRTLGPSKVKLDKDVQSHLGLDKARITEILGQLAQQGHLEEIRKGKSKAVTYRLTDAGTSHLQTLPPYRPPAPKRPDLTPEQFDAQALFLLGQLRFAPDRRISNTELKIDAATSKRLGLTKAKAAEMLEYLAHEGHVEKGGDKKNLAWTLTDAGAERHKALLGLAPHDNPQLLGYQRAYALLEVFRAGDEGLPASGFGKKLANAKVKSLDYKPRTLGWLEASMLVEGHVEKEGAGAKARYRLTPQGLSLLGSSPQYPKLKIDLTGQQFTDLMSAVRSAASGDGQAASAGAGVSETPVETPAPAETRAADDFAIAGQGLIAEDSVLIGGEEVSDEGGRAASEPTSLTDLSDVVLETFRDLLREKYSRTGMVPVHEIRQRIGVKYGEAAARHDVLDPQIKRLRLDERVRLVAIGDRSQATPEQLDASVPGVNETFFYMGEPL